MEKRWPHYWPGSGAGMHCIGTLLHQLRGAGHSRDGGRPELGDGQGMIFDVRPVGPAFFWMENTPEPLDMLFVGADGRVLHIEHETVPFSRRLRGTRKPVAAVLELAAGTAERWGVRVGDRLSLPW